jgi:hypothetical protein
MGAQGVNVTPVRFGVMDTMQKEDGADLENHELAKSPGLKVLANLESAFAAKSPGGLGTGGKKRKKPFDVVTDSVLNSPRVLEKFDKQQLQSEQENDNNTTDSILATKKSKRRKSMARRVSFAPDHSLNKLCVYEKDQEQDDFENEGEAEVKSKKSKKDKSVFGFQTNNMFLALQSPSGSERSVSSAGASLKTTDTVDSVSAQQELEVSSKQEAATTEEDVTGRKPPAAVEEQEQCQPPVAATQPDSLDNLDDTTDCGIKLSVSVQDDDTVGITFTGDLTGTLPGLADLLQEDEETTANPSTDPLLTDTDVLGGRDTLDAMEVVNQTNLEGGDTTNLFADTTNTEDVDMDVTGKLPNLSSLIDSDEQQEVQEQQPVASSCAGDGLDSPELLSEINGITDNEITMDLTENITLNLPDLSCLVEEDEEVNHLNNETPAKAGLDQDNVNENSNAVGSSTKKQAGEAEPSFQQEQDTLTNDTLTHDQQQRWGFEPGAVDTLEMDLTENGANLMGEKTFHAVYRHSMGPGQVSMMNNMPEINEGEQQQEVNVQQAENESQEEEPSTLTFHEFLQEADIQFLDFLRRGTSFGAANLINQFEEPKGLMECMELIYVTNPELGMLEKGCATLQEDVHQRKFQLADKEGHMNVPENQPEIFDAIQVATGEKLVNLKFDVQQLKRCCRQQTSQAWKEWRAKLEGKALAELVKMRGVLEQDLANLTANKKHLEDIFSESTSLTEHVNLQVTNLMKEAVALRQNEEECAALTRECDSVESRCGELDQMHNDSSSKAEELSNQKKQLVEELKALEEEATQKKMQMAEKQSTAGDSNESCTSSKVQLSEMVCEWDMMVALSGGDEALEAVKSGMKEQGKMHMSEWQSILRQSVLSNFYDKEIERCMQQYIGNISIEKTSESTIMVNVMDSLKSLKVSLNVSLNLLEGQSSAGLNRALCTAPAEVLTKVEGVLSQQKGIVPLTALVKSVLNAF